ncbi:MAG: hypothetical protein ABJB03_09235 [Rhodoglobus sp.]
MALDEVRELVRDALRGTTFANPISLIASGWGFFEPHVRFAAVDATHTRIEIDLTGTVRGAETLLFVQRRAEVDRFFVAIQDELDRRERWRPHPPAGGGVIESAD